MTDDAANRREQGRRPAHRHRQRCARRAIADAKPVAFPCTPEATTTSAPILRHGSRPVVAQLIEYNRRMRQGAAALTGAEAFDA